MDPCLENTSKTSFKVMLLQSKKENASKFKLNVKKFHLAGKLNISPSPDFPHFCNAFFDGFSR